MSHMTQLELKIDDLDALAAACTQLGLELRRGQTRFAWYGQFLGDSIGLRDLGISEADYNKCAHAIGRVGLLGKSTNEGGDEYEIGVIALPEGGYTLRFDYWGPGQKLAQLCGGNQLAKLDEEYTAALCENQFAIDGYETRREVVDGHIDVVAFK